MAGLTREELAAKRNRSDYLSAIAIAVPLTFGLPTIDARLTAAMEIADDLLARVDAKLTR